MESFSGRLFSPGIEGRLAAASAPAFLRTILAQTTAHLLLIHDGARSHTSQATTPFLAQPAARRPVCPLPSYAPADKPMEYLGQKTTQRATQHQYCKAGALLTGSVEKALAYFATHPATV